MTDEQYKKAYKKGYAHLESIAESKKYEIVEDTFEYEYGLLLIERDANDDEIGHICIDLRDFI